MRHLRRRRPARPTPALYGLLIAVVAGTVAITEPTAAAAAPATGARPAHCVLRPTPEGAAPVGVVCLPTFRAAISVATGGRVTDAPLDARAALADPGFTARLTAGTTAGRVAPDGGSGTDSSLVLGIEYSDANFGGSTLTLTGAAACDNSSDIDVQFGSLPSGWNDQISSVRGFNLCEQVLYRDVNFTGVLTGTIGTTGWVGGSANDLASSIRLF
jgi:hypothetical protein